LRSTELFDEPLSNLDAGLRERMRFELVDLQRRLGRTSVCVTHDQAEAMLMNDRGSGPTRFAGNRIDSYLYFTFIPEPALANRALMRRRPIQGRLHAGGPPLLDLIVIVCGAGGILLMIAYAALCDRI
jgi:hypothetical protein